MHRVLEKTLRVAAGYLFCGPPDSAKLDDALAFAQRLGCGKFDLVRAAPDGAAFKIDQVRDLQARVRYGPSASDYLVVIVEQADTLTPDAAAAFLKTLEEPPPGVVFILLVEREDRLPATIASRCQRIIFGENYKKWERDPALAGYYEELKLAHRKNAFELLELSARIGKEKTEEDGIGGIEKLLYDLAFFAKEELKNIKQVRALLEANKNLKKKGSLKLVLDNLCLQLGEA